MNIKKVTPILLADDVDACIEFWKEFDLEATVTVPHEEKTGFVILVNKSVELMYQSFDSAAADVAEAAEGIKRSAVYLEVASLDDIIKKSENHTVVVPERTTFYGSREIYIRDPAGNLIGFAEHATEEK